MWELPEQSNTQQILLGHAGMESLNDNLFPMSLYREIEIHLRFGHTLQAEVQQWAS